MSAQTYDRTRGVPENFYTSGHDRQGEIRRMMTEIWSENSTVIQTSWNTMSIDERFWAGDQSLWNEIYSHIPAFRRKQFNFNKTRRITNMITGFQRRNRKSFVCSPQENSDQKTADQFTELLLWADSHDNISQTLSNAFEGAVVTGMNLLSLWMDYRLDPENGNLRCDNIGYNAYIIDPYWKKFDLSDCNYVWVRKYISRKQAKSLMPDKAKEIDSMSKADTKDGKFQFLPENWNFGAKDLMILDEFWYLDYRKAYMLIDQQSGQQMEWPGKADNENLRIYLHLNPQVKMYTIEKPTTKLAVMLNNNLMFDGGNPYGIDEYPFVPVVAYHAPELQYYEWRTQGVIRGLRDAQFLYNRRKQIELDILESQINSGMKVMEGSLVDDHDVFKSGQGQPLFIKSTAPAGMDSVQPIMPPSIPPTMLQVSEILQKEIAEISGVNEELLGAADDDKAGILSMLRQGAGLTTLQVLYDNLDLSHKLVGKLMMKMMQANFSGAKVKRILNEDPTPEFYNKNFGTYDCQVIEGINTTSQRTMAFQQAIYLRELGVPIPSSFLLEMSMMQRKTDLLKQIEMQEQQAQQMQQMQLQTQMAELQAKANLANSRAVADQGLGIERMSRIEENKELAVERRAKAVHDLDLATIEKIKAAKELSGMDMDQLEKLVNIIKALEEESKEDIEEAEGGRNVKKSTRGVEEMASSNQ